MKEAFVASVKSFTELAGCTTDQFNARQTALYIGLQLEEMAEKLDAAFGCRVHLTEMLMLCSQNFKEGHHDELVEMADREDLLDADVDLAWVTVGSMLSQGANVVGAMHEVSRANHDKFPGGVVTKDENGKVKKPDGWRGPDMSLYVKKENAE